MRRISLALAIAALMLAAATGCDVSFTLLDVDINNSGGFVNNFAPAPAPTP